ncbi:type II and III secretion system protein family protein [Trinickia fusca]|uniref:Secretin n=1 Tax=Trinickia fusca TaxID=2419777 RepID=A0A494WZ56_9BURK|nr:type II and III secretion system protein family protein [Trinickia fusca]RKP43815.1 secretin [Trinickia fusca]
METKLKCVMDRAPRRRILSAAVLAALLGAGLATPQAAQAQVAAESGPLMAKGGRPMPMKISMAAVPAGATAAAAAAAAAPLRGPNCTGAISEESSVTLAVGKSTLVPLAEPVRNRTLGNPTIVQGTLVSPRTLYLVGMNVGTTNMIVQGQSGACQIIDVMVNVDAVGLQKTLAQLLPEEHGIRVSTAAGNLVLGGHVSSAPVAVQAMEIAKAYAGAQPTQQSQSASSSSGNGSTSMSQQTTSSNKDPEVINMMNLDSPQQVMLEVKVAEVSKTLIDQLGSSLNLQGGFGSWQGALVSNLLTGASTLLSGSKANKLPLQMSIDAQKTDNLTKILAEPNLVAVSGQEASFLAGGKVFIPVPQSNSNGGTTIVLQEEEFGVGLKFTPTVLANGHINLRVAPEVSELSPTGVTVSALGTSSTAILPLITTRRASTTVQMNDGESFAIGGLIGNNITGALKALPGLGELPVIGALMRSTSFQQDRTELVFVITPHLVKPLTNPNYPLPTDSFTQPKDIDVYATGDMEGRNASHVKTAAPAVSPQSKAPTQPTTPSNTQPSAALPAPVPRAPEAPADSALVPRDKPATEPAPASTHSASSEATAPQTTKAVESAPSAAIPAPVLTPVAASSALPETTMTPTNVVESVPAAATPAPAATSSAAPETTAPQTTNVVESVPSASTPAPAPAAESAPAATSSASPDTITQPTHAEESAPSASTPAPAAAAPSDDAAPVPAPATADETQAMPTEHLDEANAQSAEPAAPQPATVSSVSDEPAKQ